MSNITEPRPSLVRRLAGLAALAGLGAAVGYAVANNGLTLDLPWPDSLALLVALMLLATALISLVMLVVRPHASPRGCGVLQGAVMGLAGVLMLLPVAAAGRADPGLIYAVILALVAVQSAANLILWRRADEMLRRVMWEACAMAFWTGQIALFLYAAAERLSLVEPVSAWGLMGVLMVLYFAASVVAGLRRGLT